MSFVASVVPRPPAFAGRLPFYLGWVQVTVAALAMVGTLPGRTQGLGLITEPMLRELGLGRVGYAQINLVATLVGSLACVGFGALIDRWGVRLVVGWLALALGAVVVGMSGASGVAALAVGITLSRALGQSALSVASLSVAPQWFRGRLPMAMGLYSVLLSLGFMAAFPWVGAVVESRGWRVAWAGIGWVLVLGLAPLAWALLRRSPESCGLEMESEGRRGAESSGAGDRCRVRGVGLGRALRTPAFWVFAVGSSLYNLVVSGIGIFNEAILKERGFAAADYHVTLAITALTALVGNLAGGWLVSRGSLTRWMAGALALLGFALFLLPGLSSRGALFGQAILMGLAGGWVTVLFFTVWGRCYGRAQVGRIQGAAQALTVVGSAVGPLILARVVSATGSYALAFWTLGGAVVVVGVLAWFCPVPELELELELEMEPGHRPVETPFPGGGD